MLVFQLTSFSIFLIWETKGHILKIGQIYLYKSKERVTSMAYEEKYKKPEQPHNLILEGRHRLSVSGVEDVDNFDEREVVISTVCGTLIIKGSELHIEKLSIDGGDFILEGEIESMTYEASVREKGSLWSRLFK